jgi:Rod binding domain-containing protein
MQSSLLDAQASQLLQRSASKPTDDAKIAKASRDFESILLGSWLQQAEKSFGSVPGGDETEDEDAGKDQFQGIAMHALAGSLAASGGIGIGKMIAAHLHKSASHEAEDASSEANPSRSGEK